MKASVVLGAAVLLLASSHATGADLVGTYSGKLTCKWVSSSGEKFTTKDASMLEVSQTQTLGTSDNVTLRLPNIGYYFGNVIFDPRNPAKAGSGVVNDCAHRWNSNAFTYEMLHFKSSSTPGQVKGGIKVDGIIDHSGADGSIGTCAGSFVRVDVADPDVPFCPAVPPGPPGPNAYHTVLNGFSRQVIGSDGYPGILGGSARTVSWWYRSHVSSLPAVWGLIAWGFGDGASEWAVLFEGVDGGGISLDVYGAKIAWTANKNAAMAALQDGQWHHLVMTAPTSGTMGDVRLYLDGTLLPVVSVVGGQLATSYNTRDGTARGTDWLFRAGSRPGGNYADVDFDEIAIWNEELSAGAVSEIYNNGGPTDLTQDGTIYQSASALQLYWRFQEGTGLTTQDSSGHGHGGTLSAGDAITSWGAPGANR